MNKVAIYIPDEDARQFLLFQEHYDAFKLLVENNVFSVRNGSVTLHFDKNGVIKSINRADSLYSARHE